MATTRNARAHWEGTLFEGQGTVELTSSGIGTYPITWASRAEEANGKTSPEELIAAAHAGCFTMALAAFLGGAGFTPQKLSTEAALTMEQVQGNWTITAVHLALAAQVPGISREKFEEIAANAKANCPVSRALNAKITLAASLETP